jgi:ADP-ribosylglycohydrolase
MDRDVLYDRILGYLACACMGDVIGAPAEQRSIVEIQHLHQEVLEVNGLELEGTAARFSSLVADKAGIR